MAEGAWDHTAHVLAKLHNVNCTKDSDLLAPRDFHPLRQGKEVRQMAPVSALKSLFRL